MKFSIIVPMYFGEAYLPALVAMAQANQKTLGVAHKLELILVNDSPQAPIEAAQFAGVDMSISVLENKQNLGIHATRVAGIAVAQGDYVLLLDQDDCIVDDYFCSQIKHLRFGTAVVVANGITESACYEKRLYRWRIMQWTVKYLLFYALFDCRILSPGQCLIRKTAFPAQWLAHPLHCNGADDMLLWLMLLSDNARFEINRDVLYRHCYTASNVSLNQRNMQKSVEEMLAINNAQTNITTFVLRLLSDRLAFEMGKKNSLFWKVIQRIRAGGEQVNRK